MLFMLISLLAANPPLELEVGNQHVLQVSKPGRVKVEHPSILEVRELGDDQLILLGVSVGTTRLTIGAEVKSVRVVPASEARRLAELKSMLGPMTGLSLGFEKGCPWFECPTCSPEALARVEEVLALYPCVRAVQVLKPRRDALVVLRGAREVLGEGPGVTPGLSLDVRDGTVVLLGVVQGAEERRKVEILRRQFPELRIHVE